MIPSPSDQTGAGDDGTSSDPGVAVGVALAVVAVVAVIVALVVAHKRRTAAHAEAAPAADSPTGSQVHLMRSGDPSLRAHTLSNPQRPQSFARDLTRTDFYHGGPHAGRAEPPMPVSNPAYGRLHPPFTSALEPARTHGNHLGTLASEPVHNYVEIDEQQEDSSA